ncbi:hypothetical protein ElyMa_006735700 [Elysia marginata]|uniref:Uncharacterized protein n=1 Tax=Elysia marginata TaxID=1093978 RepID=A0AAV4IUC1_9GAST|nr:hypothetical protein ElyMa_006735700 [Elysia marginata]
MEIDLVEEVPPDNPCAYSVTARFRRQALSNRILQKFDQSRPMEIWPAFSGLTSLVCEIQNLGSSANSSVSEVVNSNTSSAESKPKTQHGPRETTRVKILKYMDQP